MIKDKNGRYIQKYSVVKDIYGDFWTIVKNEVITGSGTIKCQNGCRFIYWQPELLEVV